MRSNHSQATNRGERRGAKLSGNAREPSTEDYQLVDLVAEADVMFAGVDLIIAANNQ